jgi:signal peptidase I
MTDETKIRTVNDPVKKQDEAAEAVRTPPMNAREEWMDFLRTAFIAIVLALLVRAFYLEPFNIPSGSMKPTLEVGDYLFVYKPAYGYSRYSFPMGLAPIDGRIMTGERSPQRGDVVVFKLPTNPSIDYIKRVVGLPGDRIQVMNGRLHINGQMVERISVGLRQDREGGGLPTRMHEYIETLPGGVMHSIYEEGDDLALDNTEEFTVPEGHYFVMGDNRDNSQDSRVSGLVGFVPLENIVGRASFLFFSTNGHASLPEFWKWPWTVRYDRLFQKIGPVRPPEAAE